jgi:hypothetical protein
MIKDVKHFFIYLLAIHLYVIFGSLHMSTQVFAYF